MDRKKLHSLFWKTAKHGAHYGQPYSCALNAVLNSIEQEERPMNTFVPVGRSQTREVELKFSNGNCTLCVNGINVATLIDDHLVLHTHVFPEATGLSVDGRGHVNVRAL